MLPLPEEQVWEEEEAVVVVDILFSFVVYSCIQWREMYFCRVCSMSMSMSMK